MAKSELKAKSDSEQFYTDTTEYPKRILITVEVDPERPERIQVTRTVQNLSGFELYGLLHTLLRDVERQIAFPSTQRSDGIEVRNLYTTEGSKPKR